MVRRSDVAIATGDGERLAATLWLPDGDGPFAAVLEALPYRKDDVTSYHECYERFAASGYAALRLDLRGTGSSTGIATDEYPDVERDDLRTTIEWLAEQSWSSGRVGMFGTSYSGFNSLQMAAAGVPALRAVAAIYATDDRYTDDVHWCGGVLRAVDLIDYPLYMVAMNALPPVPAVFGPGWRDEWRRRIDTSVPWVLEWLAQPLDGPTWRRGSIRLGPHGAGYERMSCPTMLIAGWADGYRNNTFRTVEQYERNGLPWRLVAGPWVHKNPSVARPGPNVDADAAIIAFFDEHLRDGPPSSHARGQVYVREPVTPEPDLSFHPGRWCDIDSWPTGRGRVEVLATPANGSGGRVDSLVVRGDVGWAAWNSCGGGLPWGQPLDQRDDNARSLVYDWVIDERLELAGSVEARLTVRTDQPYGHISTKLCDVFPDGTSALVARGMLDLTHRGCWPADPAGQLGSVPRPLVPGEWVDVRIQLDATTWTLQPGHVLRLAVAGTDWPNCWPPPGPVTLDVDATSVRVEMPVVEDWPDSAHAFAPGSGPSAEEAAGVDWVVEHNVLDRTTVARTRYGGTYPGGHSAIVTDDYRGDVGVSTLNPADAWAHGVSTFDIEWPDVRCRSRAELTVRSDATSFHVDVVLQVSESDDVIAERSWTASVPRSSWSSA